MKLSKENISEIKLLRSKGSKLKDISKRFNVDISTICYHTNEELRTKKIEIFKTFSKEKKSKIYKNRKKYLREWYNKRYNTDSEFRDKERKRLREYYKRNKV